MRSWSSVHWTEREWSKVEQEKRRWTTKRNLSYFLSLRCLIPLTATCMTTWPAPIAKSEVSNLVANVLVLSLALRQDLCRMKKTESNSRNFMYHREERKCIVQEDTILFLSFFQICHKLWRVNLAEKPRGFYWELLLHLMVHKEYHIMIVFRSLRHIRDDRLIDWLI